MSQLVLTVTGAAGLLEWSAPKRAVKWAAECPSLSQHAPGRSSGRWELAPECPRPQRLPQKIVPKPPILF